MLHPERIRESRKQARLAQWQLAQLIGTDQAHISRIERGERPDMSVQTLEKLADALGVSTDYLLGRSEIGWNREFAERLVAEGQRILRETARKTASAPQKSCAEQEEATPRPRRGRPRTKVGV
jgi:transcriptional regulator with XRE-family HTH domain